jgi:hypothetical protein
VPRRGYQILTGQAEWPPSVETGWIGIFGFDDHNESALGRGIYFVLLSIALVALPVGLSSWLRQRLPLFLLRLLKALTLLISTLIICEFSGPTLFILSFWLVPFAATLIALLLLLVLRRRPATCAALRRGLIISLIPLVFANLIYLGLVFRALYGLAVLYLAAHVLTAGFFLLIDERQTRPGHRYSPSVATP